MAEFNTGRDVGLRVQSNQNLILLGGNLRLDGARIVKLPSFYRQ